MTRSVYFCSLFPRALHSGVVELLNPLNFTKNINKIKTKMKKHNKSLWLGNKVSASCKGIQCLYLEYYTVLFLSSLLMLTFFWSVTQNNYYDTSYVFYHLFFQIALRIYIHIYIYIYRQREIRIPKKEEYD